jgi:hypothetical protein
VSAWAKLAGIGLGVAGAVTGNPALLSAGASVFGADVAAEGAKKAAKTQAAAADKALAEGNQRYDAVTNEMRGLSQASDAGFAPYQQLGTGAVGTLGSLVGLPPIAASPVNASQPVGAPVPMGSAGQPPAPPVVTQDPQSRAEATRASVYSKRGELGDLGRMAGLVTLQAPTGEIRRVPARMAERFVAQGAQVVQ